MYGAFLMVYVCYPVFCRRDEPLADLEEDVLCGVVHTVDSADEAHVLVEEFEACEVSPGVFFVLSHLGSQGVREEHIASDEELHVVG